MTHEYRMKTLTCCIAAALGSLTATMTLADSGLVADTVLGNSLNPGKLTTVPARDPEALNAVPYQRSPTGFLFGWPKMPLEQKTTDSGWKYSGWAEFGGINVSGDEDNGWYRKYKDVGDGASLYLNNFFFQADKDAYFIETYGGGLGFDDQFFGLKGGRYNDWKLNFFYNETPHVFTSNYYSLWSGVGSGDLKLIGGLKPGGRVVDARTGPSQAIINAANAANQTANLNQVAAVVENLTASDLDLIRKKGGVDLDKYINNQWRVFGRLSLEDREGARPFGSVWGGGGGNANAEIPEPIDYDTYEILGGLRFDDGRNNLNLQAQASLFRNDISTLRWENPLYVNPANGLANRLVDGELTSPFTMGELDLYPDNNYYNLLAEYARSFNDPYKTRLTAVASVSRFDQDDDLLAQSLSDGVDVGTAFYPSAPQLDPARTGPIRWNDVSSLSRQSADAQIDTRLFQVGVITNPLDALAVQAKIRYYETENDTEYLACNPLSGQWGRVINNGSGASIASFYEDQKTTAYTRVGCDPEALSKLYVSNGSIKIRNSPYEYQKINYTLTGDYRLGRASSVNLAYDREEYDREYRERDETWEDRLTLGYTNRGLDFGSLRLSAQYAERRGSSYNVEGNIDERSTSLADPVTWVLPPATTPNSLNPWIHAPSGLRKYDLANRDQLKLSGRFNLIALDPLDVGLTAEYQNNDYPSSDFGRNDTQDLLSLGLDVNYQPSSKLGLTGFYNYQQGSLEQSGVQPGTGAEAGAPAAVNCIVGQVYGGTKITDDNFHQVCGALYSGSTELWRESRIWSAESEDSYHMFGAGGRYDFGWARFELDYTFITGLTKISYDYAASLLTPAQADLAGDGFPDLDSTQRYLDFNMIVPINKDVAVRGLYRYEQGTIDTFYYSGDAEIGPAGGAPANNAAYLDGGPLDYDAHLFGLFVQVKF